MITEIWTVGMQGIISDKWTFINRLKFTILHIYQTCTDMNQAFPDKNYNVL